MGSFRIRLSRKGKVLFAGNKPGDILPGVDHNLEGVRRTLALVILFQLLTQPVHFHPHDGVSVLVEVRFSSQDFDGERVFLNLVGPALEVFVANVLQQSCLSRGLGKDA
jgi:hypothetical protein